MSVDLVPKAHAVSCIDETAHCSGTGQKQTIEERYDAGGTAPKQVILAALLNLARTTWRNHIR
eukprot:scaffold12958_cov29-Prasinocladus_malaysianus.AAC.1